MARWNYQDRYWGTFKTSNGTEKVAYFQYKRGAGFVLYFDNNKPALPTAYPSLKAFREAGYSFKVTHNTVPEMEAVA